MNKIDAENLFASLFQRWQTGDVSNLERDYSEEVELVVDDQTLHIEDLKARTVFFHENFEIVETKFEDFLFDDDQMAVRKWVKLRNRKDNEVTESRFCWFFEMKNNQITKYWVITNFSFGFSAPSEI